MFVVLKFLLIKIVQIVLIDLKFNRVRILVAIPSIVHGYDTAIDVRIVVENRAGKVSGKGGDTTLSWQIAADQSD